MTPYAPNPLAKPGIRWQRPSLPVAPTALIVGALIAGTVAAAVAIAPSPGAGAAVAIAAVTGTVWPFTRGRRDAALLGWGACSIVLSLVVVLRDAPWLVAIDLIAAAGLASLALVRPRTLVAHALAGGALVLAPFRGAGWLTGGAKVVLGGQRPRLRPWLRAVALSAPLLVVFGLLFSSADAAFSAFLSMVTPHVSMSEVPARITVFGLAALCVLAAGYLIAATPRFDEVLAPTSRRPARIEWVLPLASLVALVGVFVSVQIQAWLGGDDYIRRTAGLTYADYARTGFAQLVVAAVLTLVVIAGAVRWVPRMGRADRLLRDGLLGALCVFTLIVLASAAHRLSLYDANFGLTQLRLCVMASIAWIGAIFVLVLMAGITRRQSWLPHAIVASMVTALLGLTIANPDARVADSLVHRFQRTGQIDAPYLATLSADAVPALARLDGPTRACILTAIGNRWHRPGGTGAWTAANFARSTADDSLRAAGIDVSRSGQLAAPVSPAACWRLEWAGP